MSIDQVIEINDFRPSVLSRPGRGKACVELGFGDDVEQKEKEVRQRIEHFLQDHVDSLSLQRSFHFANICGAKILYDEDKTDPNFSVSSLEKYAHMSTYNDKIVSLTRQFGEPFFRIADTDEFIHRVSGTSLFTLPARYMELTKHSTREAEVMITQREKEFNLRFIRDFLAHECKSWNVIVTGSDPRQNKYEAQEIINGMAITEASTVDLDSLVSSPQAYMPYTPIADDEGNVTLQLYVGRLHALEERPHVVSDSRKYIDYSLKPRLQKCWSTFFGNKKVRGRR